MHALIQDVRYAMRQLRQSPAFALTAMLTLAAGIAATTVVFSIVNAVLLRPLPFPQAQRLIAVDVLRVRQNGVSAPILEQDVSYPNFYDWRDQAKSFQSLSSYKTAGYTLSSSSGGAAQRVVGVVSSSDLLTTLGVSPQLGRAFLRSEEQPGNRSVILSHALWQSQFAGSPGVLGKTVRIDDENYTVVGVMGSSFQFPVDTPDAAFWLTQAHDAEGKNASATQRGWSQIEVVGRLRDGVTLAQAQSEMNAIQKSLSVKYPDDDQNIVAASLSSLNQELIGDSGKPLRILFGCVSFLLLIACANVAGLLLTRANARRSEMSIRTALGARRAQIVRQVLLESLTLAGLGGVLGLALAALLLKSAPLYLPASLPRVHDVSLDLTVSAFALGLSLLTGLLFGALPAWRMSGLDPALALREGARGSTASKGQHRVQSALVIAETAVGLVLLVGAGLLLRSFDRILHVDPGFRPDHMFTFRIGIPDKRYTDEQRNDFFNRLMPQLEALPGVKSASGAFPLPLTGGSISIGFSVVGQNTSAADQPSARLSLVEPNFFSTLGLSLRAGRFFASADHHASAPQVVIVNETFARRFFPGKSAIGQHIQTDVGVTETPIREIVGVVGDVKRSNLTEASQPEYYIPIEQGPLAPPSVAVRVAGDPSTYEATVRALVARMDSSLPVYRYRTYGEDLARITAQQRFEAVLLTGFAAVALLLSAVGLYGVLSYTVGQRTKEIGLRMALGAQRSTVRNQILRQGLTLGLTGLCLGAAVSALLTRFLASLLFGVGRFDILTFAGMALLLFAVTCLASLAPAYRASRLEPMEALRAE
jgi:predicted permease